MNPVKDDEREAEHVQKRLTRMGRAFLQINGDLDAAAFLHTVVESAWSLNDATYGMITLLEDGGQVHNRLVSGLFRGHAVFSNRTGVQNQGRAAQNDGECPQDTLCSGRIDH